MSLLQFPVFSWWQVANEWQQGGFECALKPCCYIYFCIVYDYDQIRLIRQIVLGTHFLRLWTEPAGELIQCFKRLRSFCLLCCALEQHCSHPCNAHVSTRLVSESGSCPCGQQDSSASGGIWSSLDCVTPNML